MESLVMSEQFAASIEFFIKTTLELAILFIGISFGVGLLTEYLPKEKMQRLLSGSKGRGYLIGGALGSLTPFCSCSTIPMMVGLLRAGASFGPVMTYLFVSPLLNPILLALFIPLLGLKLAIMYSILAMSLSIVAGFLLERFGFVRFLRTDVLPGVVVPQNDAAQGSAAESDSARCCEDPQPLQNVISQPSAFAAPGGATQASPVILSVPMVEVPAPQESVVWRIFKDAVQQFRSLLLYILLGVSIGAIIHGFVPTDLVERLAGPDNPFAIPVAAFVGVPLYLRVSTMLPIAAGLVAKGMSLGAVIALIIGGAGASLPEVAMLKGLFRLPLLTAFLISVFTMAITAGFTIQFLVG